MAPKSVSATVKYHKPGTTPPVYLAGSFSNPEWQPTEMEYTVGEDNELDFHSQVQAEEGREYQYKFRIGEGDWWVLNEDSPSGTDNAGNRNNIFIAPVSNPAFIEESANTRPAPKSKCSPAEMDHTHSEAFEERMSTREPSDGLFDDEIIKESDDTSTSHPYVELIGNENWAPPSASRPAAAKTSDSQRGYLNLLDGTGPESAEEAKQEQISREAGNTNKSNVEKEEHIDSTPNQGSMNPAEEKENISNGKAHDTKPATAKSTLTDTPAVKVEEVPSDKDLKLDNSTKGQGIVPSLSIKEIDAKDDDSTGATLSEQEQGSEPGYIMVEDRALTPDLASTAAEVADSAAELDPREPTPPISDEEAGRIGYRRMSNTPIQQVAATAAEVADVAKLLDDESPRESASREFDPTLTSEQLDWSGPETPEEEKIRRLPAETTGDTDSDEEAEESYTPEISSPTMTRAALPEELARLPTLNIVPIVQGEDHDGDMTILSDIQEESILETEEQPLPPITIGNMDSGADAANDSDNRSKKQAWTKGHLILPSLNPTPVYPNTPFIRSGGQLSAKGELEEAGEPSRDIGGPSINLIPATPRGSSMYTSDPMDDSDGKAVDTAKSTAIEEKLGLIRARKGNASPAPDRPLTPNSVRSAGKEAHERNFLKAFWRVVFVDWIGGFILRLCGGERRRTA